MTSKSLLAAQKDNAPFVSDKSLHPWSLEHFRVTFDILLAVVEPIFTQMAGVRVSISLP